MPVINLPVNDSTDTTTRRALSTAFENVTSDTPGQLYAYHYSNTSVVLGTRLSVTPNGSIETAVGISEVADGTYRCIARNFANGTSESEINITARNNIIVTDRTVYLRFSTDEAVQDTLGLSSSEFVSAMFQTMVRVACSSDIYTVIVECL